MHTTAETPPKRNQSVPAEQISPLAGTLPQDSDLIDVNQLIKAYEDGVPDANIPAQAVQFGTSGHRGTSLELSFNRNHILAITQGICQYRKKKGINGPLFLGFDTHALSQPAFENALEVLVANDVSVIISQNREYTPTPTISHAILTYNQNRKEGFADGIVITPSHNPPREGGFKYNPPHGGPAEKEITDWVQEQANELLKNGLKDLRRENFAQAEKSSKVLVQDFITPYVKDLANMVDMDLIRESRIHLAVDPLGGAGVHYWQPIADHFKLDLKVLRTEVDPCFRFMTRDWDGQIRMDPSSKYAMASLIEQSRNYDVSFACDTDHDRHGIVTKTQGLMPPNHFLTACIHYLFQNRPQWKTSLQVGKTAVSSQMIDRVARSLGRSIYEVPVGFKWFVDGLLHEKLGFVGEESAGATFLRRNGHVWTTDKDGFVPCLLAAEMMAKTGRDPAQIYQQITRELGPAYYQRVDAPINQGQKKMLLQFDASHARWKDLGGDPVTKILSRAPGNGASLGGFKVETTKGWIAVRPSGTEEVYKIYAESIVSNDHLQKLLSQAQDLVKKVIHA